MRHVPTLTASVLMAVASVCAAPTSFADGFSPNEFEAAYANIAPAFASPALCDRISPKAYVTAGFDPPGHQISYRRSNCFLNVALKLGDKELCREVKSISTLFLNGAKMSSEACLEDIDRKSQPHAGTFRAAELILKFLGYSDDDLRRASVGATFFRGRLPGTRDRSADPVQYHSAYLDIRFSKDQRVVQGFKERLQRLPDFSVSDEAARKDIEAAFPQCSWAQNPELICTLISDGLRRR